MKQRGKTQRGPTYWASCSVRRSRYAVVKAFGSLKATVSTGAKTLGDRNRELLLNARTLA